MANPVSNFFGGLSQLEGNALRGATGTLNNWGIRTPNYGLSTGLINQGANWQGQQPQFVANSPYGLNPTGPQQQQIAGNPGLSTTHSVVGPPPELTNQPLQGPVPGPVPNPTTNPYGNGNGIATQPGGAANGGITGRPTSFNGKGYDLADPNSRQSYYNDVIGYVTGQNNTAYAQNKKNLESAQGLALGGLNQQQAKLTSDHDNFLRDNNNQGINFNNDYTAGNAGRAQNAFGSSNVFQSGASEGQGYANNQHLRGLADLQAGASSYKNQYDQANNQLGLQRNQFNDTYDQSIHGLDKQNADSIQNAKDQLSSNLGYYDGKQNPGITSQDFTSKYSLTPYTSPTAPKVDLASLNPYASSNTLGQSPTAEGASKFLATPTSNLSSQDQYYGYNPSTTDKNYLNNFFKSGNPNAS